MNGISNIQNSGAAYRFQQTDQANRNRFENVLAAARTAESGAKTSPQTQQTSEQVDFASVLPNKNPQGALPSSKVIQSLNRLVQGQKNDTYGSLDIRQ